ncbi:MAG TPA: apolipoprotein N-acyltransferase [Sphingomicrobium sp.]|nr:apolipoprotein N-acyltransferase [Sphingomicrobium sp.]
MRYVLYAFLAGALSAFAFEPVGWWPLLLIAIAALCELLDRNKSFWRSLALGWAFGFGQFVIGLNWIATSFTYQSNMPAWLGWVAVVLLSIYLAVYPMIATGAAWWFGRDDRVVMVTVLGGAWAITEWLRSIVFTGFPWNPLAAALAPTPLVTITALIGTYGLSGLVILLSGAVWLEYYRKWLPLAVILASTALLWLLPSSAVPPDPLTIRNIRVVQPNIGQEDKWRPGFDEEAARRLATLSGPPTAEPRLLLWPEAAITDPVEDQRTDMQGQAAFQRTRVGSLLGPNDVLVTGGLAVESRDGVHVERATNSIFAIAPGGRVIGRYDKAHLVPYGEYLPMRPLLSYLGLSRLAPGDLDFTPGPGPRTLDIGGEWGKIGFDLCYEIIFSGHVVDARDRPEFIFNPSNDAWFGSWGPPQHLAQARLRAAEEGLPVIRATPTGVSAVIDARGNVVKEIAWGKAGVIDAVLPASANAPPLFARFGNAIPLLLGVLLIAGGIVLSRRRR